MTNATLHITLHADQSTRVVTNVPVPYQPGACLHPLDHQRTPLYGLAFQFGPVVEARPQ